MKRCEFCGSVLPEHAGFCGACGKSASHIAGAPTGIKAVRLAPAEEITSIDTVTLDTPPEPKGTTSVSDYATIEHPISEEDEEEKRRRAALFGLALPLAGEALGGQFPGNALTAQGTPHFGGALSGQGTPHFGGNTPPPVANMPGSGVPGTLPAISAPPLILPPPSTPPPYVPPTSPGPSSPPGSQQPMPPGCITWLIVVVLPLLLLASIFGAAITVFAPTLTGNSSVAPGGSLHVHGQSFLPGDTVSFTLDGSTHLSPSAFHAPTQFAQDSYIQHSNTSMRLLMQVGQLRQLPAADHTITVGGNSTFDATIQVGQDWSIGAHTLRASEDFSPRGASFTFQVSANGQTPTPTPTDTPTTPISTPTASPTPSPTVGITPGTSGLNGISPGTVVLGPVSTGSTQAATTQVTLSTAGSDLVPWTATWDPNQAPWLQITPGSGQIQAPGSQQIAISALPGGMAAGNYTTTVTFNGSSNKITLNVTFIVQSACITATPSSLNFSGVAGKSDPASQTLSLNNCGITGPWSSTITTDTGAAWLSINPSTGRLNNGSAQTVTVTASNVELKLPPGTYQGTIVFSNGSAQATVAVTLTVVSQPILTVTPSSINTGDSIACPNIGNGTFICQVTLTSNRGTMSLDWTASSSDKSVTFSATSGSIDPGKSVTVTVNIPMSDCNSVPQTPPVLTFTGPANTVSVPVTCGIIG
ncbi:MAG TPA: hypothetical protein VFB60_06980 [Ktedonobacteraceae bacterium]|nr:hypothetical protein [Ktedonobacteraceae bacterium]